MLYGDGVLGIVLDINNFIIMIHDRLRSCLEGTPIAQSAVAKNADHIVIRPKPERSRSPHLSLMETVVAHRCLFLYDQN